MYFLIFKILCILYSVICFSYIILYLASFLALPKAPSNRRVGRPKNMGPLKVWNWRGTFWRNILKANGDGLPNLNFDHRTLVIRKALIDARAYKPSFNDSTDHKFWCDRTLFECYPVWTNSVWNICAWCARHGIKYYLPILLCRTIRAHKLLFNRVLYRSPVFNFTFA
jgi:hypothetical protein